MTPQTFERVRELYAAARDVPFDERKAWLDLHCKGSNGDDGATLRAEVESLLAESELDTTEFLDKPPLIESPIAFELSGPGDAPGIGAGSKLGDFVLGRVLGEGGMGIVYEAEQQHPRRTVALKLIRPLFVTRNVLKRFEHEVELLARLEHPGIARVYQAGTLATPGGPQPYFAMELVRGEALNAYASQHSLSSRQRLELLARVCDAVQHAHQKGVIHRDLKPSNILVDETGQPKVLDFGVARAVDADAQAAVTMQTHTGQLVGTLPYMSPEQASGDAGAIDTRSDVYALGVIAFELLAGRLPYPVRDKSVADAVSVIQTVEPTRLSTVDRHLSGDVETIVRKALEKDRDRRYAGASALAADLRRYLNSEPISARPPSTIYQLSRFARRNKALVAGVVAVMLVLVGGIFATSMQLIRARRAELAMRLEKQEAERQERQARDANDVSRAVKEFMVEMLGAVDPREVQGPEITVRQQLDRAARVAGEKFASQPLVESEVRSVIGSLYVDHGRPAEAEVQLRAAMDARRRAVTNLDDDLLATELMKRQAVAVFMQGRVEKGINLNREVLARSRRLLGDDHPETINMLRSMGAILLQLGRVSEATPFVDEALRRARATLAEDHPLRLQAFENIAAVDMNVGRFDEAAKLYREVLGVYERVGGENGPDTLRTTGNLAVALYELRKPIEAEALLRSLLDRYRRKLGTDHADTLDVELKLANALADLQRHAEAEGLARHAYERYAAVLSPAHPLTLNAGTVLALIEAPLGKLDESEHVLREVWSRGRGDPSGPVPAVINPGSQLVMLLVRKGDLDAALSVAKELSVACEQTRVTMPPAVIAPLVELCERAGRSEDASAWRAKLPASATTRGSAPGS